MLNNGSHYLKKVVNHNHTPQASSANNVAKAIAGFKRRVSETREKPVQIIQNNMANIPEEIRPYMLSRNALRRKIARVRKVETPSEPQSIAEVNIPDSFRITLNGDLFLVKDHVIE
jgi:hypothetical protein